MSVFRSFSSIFASLQPPRTNGPVSVQTVEERRRHVTWVLNITQGTFLSPGPYERQLLESYVCGTVSLREVIVLLDSPPLTLPAPAIDGDGHPKDSAAPIPPLL